MSTSNLVRSEVISGRRVESKTGSVVRVQRLQLTQNGAALLTSTSKSITRVADQTHKPVSERTAATKR